MAFFCLKNPDGPTTDWGQGLAVQARGGGKFALTLDSESIPGFPSFPEATLQVQIVAEGAAGGILERTPVYCDVALEVCNRWEEFVTREQPSVLAVGSAPRNRDPLTVECEEDE